MSISFIHWNTVLTQQPLLSILLKLLFKMSLEVELCCTWNPQGTIHWSSATTFHFFCKLRCLPPITWRQVGFQYWFWLLLLLLANLFHFQVLCFPVIPTYPIKTEITCRKKQNKNPQEMATALWRSAITMAVLCMMHYHRLLVSPPKGSQEGNKDKSK